MFLLLFSALAAEVNAQETKEQLYPDPPSVDSVLTWEETFKYEVRYSFFRLGNVKVQIYRDTVQNTSGWLMKTIITSNSSIPFVGKEINHYNSFFVMEDSMPKELFYWRDNIDEEEYKDMTYAFSWEDKKVYAKLKDEPADTLDLEEGGGSGQLVFLMGRTFAGTRDSLDMPIYIEYEKGYLNIHGTTEIDRRKYDAFEGKVETFYSKGSTDIEGPFGFKGRFESWYLTDGLRVPLEAYVKVWLGNVKIKLTEYTKELR
ncbi:MAG: DUF3108 domain-containing protein [Balneolaceae bacterium]|nr:DUF3108 domain-containing protein [Balneolaceae bacterium]